jgi:hypothetical protein
VNFIIEDDENVPLLNYQGIPEWSVFDRDEYNVENDEDLPSLSLTTAIGVNELPVLPSTFTNNY